MKTPDVQTDQELWERDVAMLLHSLGLPDDECARDYDVLHSVIQGEILPAMHHLLHKPNIFTDLMRQRIVLQEAADRIGVTIYELQTSDGTFPMLAWVTAYATALRDTHNQTPDGEITWASASKYDPWTSQ